MQPTIEMLRDLLEDNRPPCISLYQPTHRTFPDKQQNPIRYRNLLREMRESLAEKYSAREVKSLVDKFDALAVDDGFWLRRTGGLAILASANRFEIYELQRSVPELVVVADSFHVKPLLRIVQSADRYHVLALNRKEVKLYEGNRDALDRVELEEVPSTITAALGEELTEPYQGFHGVGPYHAARGNTGIHHGRGQKKDDVDLDMERFFRAVDRAILERYSRRTRLPLLLAGLPQNVAGFRAVTHNPFVLDAAIELDPDSLSLEELRAQAWRNIEPIYLKRLGELTDSYNSSRSRGLGAEDPAAIAEAAVTGRVATLLIDAERVLPGRIDASGRIERRDLADPDADDVLDDLAETVVRMTKRSSFRRSACRASRASRRSTASERARGRARVRGRRARHLAQRRAFRPAACASRHGALRTAFAGRRSTAGRRCRSSRR
jgi:release factor family 3